MTLPYIMEEKSVDEYYTDQEVISEEDIQKLHRQQSRPVVQFTVSKIEKEAKKYWDLFYKRNEDRFFKDRHWVVREFQELLNSSSEKKVLLEIGCGTGNLIYPLLEENPFLFVYACDFSSRAIDIVKRNPLYNPDRSSRTELSSRADALRSCWSKYKINFSSKKHYSHLHNKTCRKSMFGSNFSLVVKTLINLQICI